MARKSHGCCQTVGPVGADVAVGADVVRVQLVVRAAEYRLVARDRYES